MDYKCKYWQDEFQSLAECYSDEYAEETGINKLEGDDWDKLVEILMNDDKLWQRIDGRLQEIMEDYCRNK